MVTEINNLKSGTVGFRMIEEVTKEDYDKVILPVIKKSAERYTTLNLLLVVSTDLSKFTVGAWIKDAVFGLKNLTTFDRVALISDSEVVKGFASVANTILPGNYKYYPLSEEANAKTWIDGL